VKLTVFHASDGDCLLLSSTSSSKPARRVLVDGGRRDSYVEHTRPFIGTLRQQKQKIHVLCVSHIDDDHITGILQLVEDEVAWRAHAFARTLDPQAPPPPVPRPAEIGEVWHNGLFRLVGDTAAPVVEGVLENVATVLAGSTDPQTRDRASELADLAAGERSSMELSRRLSPEQLKIKLNPRAQGGLVKRGEDGTPAPGEKVTLGSLRLFVLGPSDDDIERLRKSWKQWLDDSAKALRKLQAEMLADEDRLGAISPEIVANPMLDAALGDGLSRVTAANLASLMLLVEEGSRSVLLTGDGVSQEILDGLAYHKKLDAAGRVHVNVLKVPHHGAEANTTADFVARVTADHYVFCGDGNHSNPEKSVVEAYAKARLGGFNGQGPLGPSTPFTFWFTTSSATPDTSKGQKRQKHMKMIEQTVLALRQGHHQRFKANFLTAGHFEISA
jgi:hypothetical protein